MDPFSRKFEGITQAQFDVLAGKVLAQTGVVIDRPSGQAKGKGYTIGWNFMPADGSLVIFCFQAPWPQSLFPQKIGATIDAMVSDATKA